MKYDVFLSYRRDGGDALTKHLYDRLRPLGYKVFMDVESLRSGMFNVALYNVINESKNVVVILPPNALDRCVNEDDWLRKEISHAIKLKKNIIPVMMRGFQWPKDMPEDIRDLQYFNGITENVEYFDQVIRKLSKMLYVPHSKLLLWSVLAAAAVVGLGIVLFTSGLLESAPADKTNAPYAASITSTETASPSPALRATVPPTESASAAAIMAAPPQADAAETAAPTAQPQTVVFEDRRFERAVKGYMGIDKDAAIAVADAEKVDKLIITTGSIYSLYGIEKFKNLKTLVIDECYDQPASARVAFFKAVAADTKQVNAIKDYTPLLSLPKLETLVIFCNTYTDLETIGQIASLRQLRLSGQYIGFETGDAIDDDNADIDKALCGLELLSGLVNLEELDISRNYVRDFTVLSSLKKLHKLNVSHNGTKAKPPILDTLGPFYGEAETHDDWTLRPEDLAG